MREGKEGEERRGGRRGGEGGEDISFSRLGSSLGSEQGWGLLCAVTGFSCRRLLPKQTAKQTIDSLHFNCETPGLGTMEYNNIFLLGVFCKWLFSVSLYGVELMFFLSQMKGVQFNFFGGADFLRWCFLLVCQLQCFPAFISENQLGVIKVALLDFD